MKLEWRNLDQTILAKIDGNHIEIVEEGHPEWVLLSASDDIAPFVLSPEPAPLEVERAGMVVSRLQARGALLLSNKLDDVEALISGTPEAPSQVPPLVKLAWADATVFRRSSPAIASLAGLVGLSDEDLDDLFRLAATIDV